jgi:PAS domain S-box-containing protein
MAGDQPGADGSDGPAVATVPRGLGRAVTVGGLVLTVVLLLVSMLDLWSDYREATRSAQQNVRNLARVLAAQTQAAIGTVDQALLHVIHVLKTAPVEANPDDPEVHRLLLELTEQVPFLREVDIFDAKGDPVQLSRVQPIAPFNVANREYFRFHRDHPEAGLYVGPPIRGKVTGRWLFTLTRRLETTGGKFAGVVLGVLDTDYLQRLYESIDVGQYGVVSLLLYDGRILARSPFDEKQLGTSLADVPMFKAFRESGRRSEIDIGRYRSDGRVRILAHEVLDPGPLVITVAMDWAEVLADWYRGALLYGVAVVAFMGLMALMIRLLRVQLRRRERAEAASRESERLAVSTIDALTAQLCVLDETGTLIVANRAWHDAAVSHGAPPAAVGVGANYLAVCDAAEGPDAVGAAAFAAGIRAVMAGTRSEHIQEYPCLTAYGQEWYVGRVTRFASSGPIRVVVLHQNITERRQTALALLREKERAETYLAISESIIIELDLTGRIRRVNPRGCLVLGYAEEALLGHDWFELVIPPSIREVVRAAHGQAVHGVIEVVEYFENEVVTSRGDLRVISWHNSLVMAADGRIAGTLSSGQDVTERRRAEDRLRQSERRLAQAQTIAHLGNWEENLCTGEICWSEEVYRIFGRGPEVFAAGFAGYLRFVHPDDRAEVEARKRLLVDSGTPFNLDHRIVLGDGTVRTVNLQCEPVEDADGVAVSAHGIVHDITDRKRAELDLRRAVRQAAIANRTKTEFLANMSHELNTPLNAVIGFSEMMAEELCGPLGGPKYRDFARVIHRSGRHLQTIISDILDIAKVDGDQMPLDEEVLDLAELIGERLHQLEPAAAAGGLTLVPPAPGIGLGLMADRRMIKQILRNLISNAIKFTPPGGTVAVSVVRADDLGLCLDIEDTGIGMAPEDIPLALDRFSQVDSTLARPYEGTGLGLSLAKSLVEKHGGVLEIDSAPGCGTTVRVRFPAERVFEMEPAGEHASSACVL